MNDTALDAAFGVEYNKIHVKADKPPRSRRFLFGEHYMWSYIWPLLLIVVSNTVYNIAAKETPGHASAFLSLTGTYIVAAVVSFIAYLLSSPGKTLGQGISELNWSSIALGFVIVGLETGYIYLYRAGWKVSVASIVANVALAAVLLIVGLLFYKETIGVKQVIGIVLCLGGLVLING